VDVNNAPDLAFADGLAPTGDSPALPPRARWRQRPIGRSRAAPACTAGTLRLAPGTPASPAPRRPDGASDDDMALPGAPGVKTGATDLPAGLASSDAEVARHGNAASETGMTTGTGPIDSADDQRRATDASDDTALAGDGSAAAHPDALLATEPTPDAAMAMPDADPQRAPRDTELWLLARRNQGAALRLDFELRTAVARQVFRRDFVYVSRQLHALEASRRVQGLDRARFDGALATLRERADAIQAFMAQRAADLRASIEARGAAGARIAFARPARFEAMIVSPGAHRFLTLLMQADETLAQLETAWLLGLIEPAARSALVSDIRRALLGFKDLACDLRHAVGLLVQEINARRREGDASAPHD
jgi:hypothetical protein